MQKKALPRLYIQSPKLNQLNILREVAADAHITQAELADRCSLSVAMVNNYMKELCGFGWMEYHRKTIKNVTYHLTPAGMQQVEALQSELMDEMVGMYETSKEQIRSRIMSQGPTVLHRVILFGTGPLAQLVFHALEKAGINILGICSDDSKLVGSDFCGREVMGPSQIRFLSPDAVIVADSFMEEATPLSLESFSDRSIHIIQLNRRPVPEYAGKTEANPSKKVQQNETADPKLHQRLAASGSN